MTDPKLRLPRGRLGDRIAHKRHPDWEAFDRIELVTTPRFKTSGLSGDEWRTSVQVKFWFKGEVVHETGFRDMKTALALLSHDWFKAQEPIPDRVIKLEYEKCDQPGCDRDIAGIFKLKRKFSDRGELLDASDSLAGWTEVRGFCKTHLERGDCSREDCDDNYELVEGLGPDSSTNTTESPSIFGGAVKVTKKDIDG